MSAAVRRRHPRTERACQRLLEHSPAMAALALWVEHVDAPDLPAPAATDGRRILYGPSFERHPLEEQATILAHEVLHVALRHPQRAAALAARARDWDPHLWNVAADALLNEGLAAQPWARLPEGACRLAPILSAVAPDEVRARPELLQASHWDAERLYAFLAAHRPAARALVAHAACPHALPGAATPDQPQDGTARAPHADRAAPARCPGDVLRPPWVDPAAEHAAAREWAQRLRQAAAGDRPGGLLRAAAADTRDPGTPWEQVLRRYVVTATAPTTAETWSRPSRRRLALGPRVPWEPGALPRPVPRVAVCVDTSGSIDQALFERFVAELEAIQTRTGASVAVIVCDAAVHATVDLAHDPRGVRELRFQGGGGTDFRPALAAAARLAPAVAVYLTDLEGTFPDAPPPFPVLWAVPRRPGRPTPPFGQVLDLE